jgi:hypothetical protein
MKNVLIAGLIVMALASSSHDFSLRAAQSTAIARTKYEIPFLSDKTYENPLYDIKYFKTTFISPTGKTNTVHGFWDGDLNWKVRFQPAETGNWTYSTACSDTANSGLHGRTGSFRCEATHSELDIYRRGQIAHPVGTYHLAHADGTPFFWTGCTAWNGALLSTDQEWDKYLSQRAETGYNVIQFVTTQWRGCEADINGQVAFTGSGRIDINPEFFRRLDKKIDDINAHGLVAAPVVLWALPFGQGRHLSPGYYLPQEEAILLARYIVARFGANHVVWVLGGDGRYVDEYEQRWKEIGRGVFGAGEHQGLVSQHPHGRSWIGSAYRDEAWLDVIGYQSSHGNNENVVNWINRGPPSQQWSRLSPRPIINMEPNYEEIFFKITARDVRNASYWSMLATPAAGITYGAYGIWPWLQEGNPIQNHGSPSVEGKEYTPWYDSIYFPGSLQVGYLAEFFRKLQWWHLRPSPELLNGQPGDKVFNHHISVAATSDKALIVAYLPVQSDIDLLNPFNEKYDAQWFDPVENKYIPAQASYPSGLVRLSSPKDQDMLLILRKLDR